MGACIYDYFSPCERCGKCDKTMYKETIDEDNNEVYREVSYDGGYTWELE